MNNPFPINPTLNLITVAIYPDGRLDTHNAAIYTGQAEKTMAMQRSNGTGPQFIKRGRVFYFLEDLDKWLNASGRLNSTTQIQRERGQAQSQSRSKPGVAN